MNDVSEARRRLASRITGEGLDAIASLDYHGRGIVRPIYEALRRRQGGAPLTTGFAERIVKAVQYGNTVVLATGFMIRRAMQPETDGLTGTAYLARVLSTGLGAKPLIICEEAASRAVRACLLAAGLRDDGEDDPQGKEALRFKVVGFPQGIGCGNTSVHLDAMESVISLKPAAFITIERAGKNSSGIPHTTFGLSVEDISSDMDSVLTRMKEQGVPTLAIGDMGNELGMGVVADVVSRVTPYGNECMCGCGGGVAAAGAADFAIMGSISDDACYAAGAAIAQLTGRFDLLPDADMIRGILIAALEAGAVDGITGNGEESIDMVGWKTHEAVIRIIREVVLKADEHDRARPQFIDRLLELSDV